MIDIFFAVLFLVLTILILCGAFYIICKVVERFILVTLPTIMKLYMHLKYPREYERLVND
jgi:hypothetical protein